MESLLKEQDCGSVSDYSCGTEFSFRKHRRTAGCEKVTRKMQRTVADLYPFRYPVNASIAFDT